jgi:glutamyl-Q tRNA(Asp) synthetase
MTEDNGRWRSLHSLSVLRPPPFGMSPTFRFAPSPNGHLHLGHAYSALLNFERARAAGGRLLLRIEDIDPQRCRPEYETAIYEDLHWLGISWQEPVRRQSENFSDYRAPVAKLEAAGLIYPTFESRSEINALVGERERSGSWPRDPDGAPLYPGDARDLPPAERERRRRAGEPFALRIAMDSTIARAGALAWTDTGSGLDGQSGRIVAAPEMWGDVVLARKELPTSYHLAVVIDDALQGVTDVVRGQDLFWATSVHRLLQAVLGLSEPTYHHHRLILDADGRKLSKATQSTSLRELRAGGASPADIRRMIGLTR